MAGSDSFLRLSVLVRQTDARHVIGHATAARTFVLGPMPGTARDGLLQKGIRRSFVTDSGWFRVTTNKLVVVTKRHDFCRDTFQ